MDIRKIKTAEMKFVTGTALYVEEMKIFYKHLKYTKSKTKLHNMKEKSDISADWKNFDIQNN
jgi:hypothetical protein